MIFLMILTFIMTLSAQAYVNSTFSKYNRISSTIGKKGHEVARMILDNNGLSSVEIEEVAGHLTDHYDPKAKAVRLSSTNYNNSSISAISVAAHECGHAIQDKEGYTFMRIRASLVPIVNISTYAGYFAIAIGIAAGSLNIIWIGIIAELLILLFQLVTLPVEFDASKRALSSLEKYSILDQSEQKNGKKVLRAAAMTYVASVATAIVELLRLILLFGRRED